MKRYIQYVQDTHTPHERRQVALRISVIVTGLLFVAWLATLGVRLGNNIPAIAGEDIQNAAAALEAVQ
jgi:hypothetical protein